MIVNKKGHALGLDFIQNDEAFQVPKHEFGILESPLIGDGFQIKKGRWLIFSENVRQGSFSCLSRPQ